MCVLEDCVSNINAAGNELMTPAINMAVKRCSDLAEDLAFRRFKLDGVGRTRKVIYELNAWSTLRSHLLDDLLGRERAKFSGADPTAHESQHSDIRSFTVNPQAEADSATIKREFLLKDIAKDLLSNASPSLVMGTIAVTHESKPRYVPVRAKYDTGADVNFMPITFLEKHGLSSMQEELAEETPGDNVFIGLNNEEYPVRSTVTLHWCASNMHRMRTTKFHVANDMPFDMLLGDPFIQENKTFDPQRVALPLRRKHRSSLAQRMEEERLKAEIEAKEAESLHQSRLEDKRLRELRREAQKIAKSQTSASSMSSVSSANSSPGTSAIVDLDPNASNPSSSVQP
ncbi:hypothetical protein KC339_g13886 [Hortaea werneckii]|nr:hypothetical protein KC339_g13886 [Hortaea werneckii]